MLSKISTAGNALSFAFGSRYTESAVSGARMPYPIQFPADEQAHPTIVEWWYVNGNVRDADGRSYQFMTCLFKADPKKIKLPFFKFLPLKTVCFMHEIVTDNNAQRAYQSAVPVALATVESFTRPLLHVQTADWQLTESTLFTYALRTPHLSLTLASQKPPLLENQTGFIDLQVKTTYYYSLSRLRTSGTLRLGQRTVSVTGLAWLDHQWADCGWQPKDDIWVWFSLQLDNGMEVVVFRYGGETQTELATASMADGTLQTTRVMHLQPLGKPWRSAKTGARYPLSWNLRLPELQLQVQASPLNQNQEIVFGVINYWEGGITVHGTYRGQPINGTGFLELAGIPIEKSRRKLLKQTMQKMVIASARKLDHRLAAAAGQKLKSLRQFLRKKHAK